ncbi:hypothetical protein [Sphingomonas faeni]|nr:hypothetical protein [Sphingomonas faeni]
MLPIFWNLAINAADVLMPDAIEGCDAQFCMSAVKVVEKTMT